MKAAFLISLFLVLIGCNESNNAIGHWHIKKADSNEQNYWTMEVTENRIAFLGTNKNHGVEGIHNSYDKTLFFPSDCGVFDFEYKVIQDTIYLTSHLTKYIGERFDSNSCNKLIDFKNQIK